MRTHVALLRGVNVGGRNRIAMADLRSRDLAGPHWLIYPPPIPAVAVGCTRVIQRHLRPRAEQIVPD
ncbi:MAG: DUF1697 domain-containing protein [Actinomycetota bacterium]|jgi:hypothetical protein|nr:DUF1697 domain-containing protein [Actinomycetota bacterium]